MPVDVVFGVQYGDEGKGRVVDSISGNYDAVVRYQGGANAGHTICIGKAKHVLHMVPSAIFTASPLCILGPGMVLDLDTLSKEIEYLDSVSADIDRIMISSNAHVVMPTHKIIEQEYSGRIGTTKRGIGAAYADKHHRVGVRFGDLRNPELVKSSVESQKRMYRCLDMVDTSGVVDGLMEAYDNLRIFEMSDSGFMPMFLRLGRKVLLEGAQGYHLDIDNGDYPYVTSSSIHPGAACASLGVPAHHLRDIIGVSKVYTTRVGEGPFPTEVDGDLADRIREHGQEYGATTGRPRRCGWLDLGDIVRVGRATGVNKWAFTKFDVPPLIGEMKANMGGFKSYSVWGTDDFRKEMRCSYGLNLFLRDTEEAIGQQISMMSYGPERESIILR
jgi:adenylosuccinate synthase